MTATPGNSQPQPGGIHVLARGLARSHRGICSLDCVNAEFPAGSITAVLGANGAGKSTLLRIIALVEAPDSGELTMDGANALSRPGDFRESIGYVPQEIALFEELTTRENLLCWAKGAALARIEELIATLDMAEFAAKRVSALSGGMKRRVNLAVALLNSPRLLVMDEPFVGMDMRQRETVTLCLKNLAAGGITQVISSHHPEIFRNLAGHVMALDRGRVVYDGPINEELLEGKIPPADMRKRI